MAKSKLTDELQADIVALLELGATNADVCASVGISEDTFYRWLREGNEAQNGKKSEFSEAITRAQATARLDAIETLKKALQPTQQKQVTVDEFSETRLNSKGEPYTYTRKKTRQQVSEVPGDWRAAVEYLKRRDKANWTERTEYTGEDGNAIEINVTYDRND